MKRAACAHHETAYNLVSARHEVRYCRRCGCVLWHGFRHWPLLVTWRTIHREQARRIRQSVYAAASAAP